MVGTGDTNNNSFGCSLNRSFPASLVEMHHGPLISPSGSSGPRRGLKKALWTDPSRRTRGRSKTSSISCRAWWSRSIPCFFWPGKLTVDTYPTFPLGDRRDTSTTVAVVAVAPTSESLAPEWETCKKKHVLVRS